MSGVISRHISFSRDIKEGHPGDMPDAGINDIFKLHLTVLRTYRENHKSLLQVSSLQKPGARLTQKKERYPVHLSI